MGKGYPKTLVLHEQWWFNSLYLVENIIKQKYTASIGINGGWIFSNFMCTAFLWTCLYRIMQHTVSIHIYWSESLKNVDVKK